jgi:hypothetical protein
MAFLDWVKRSVKSWSDGKEQKVSLSSAERWALRRMIGHYDDGIVGHGQRGEWEKTFNAMAERLSIRFRDPFGDASVRISAKEVEALRHFQGMYERDVSSEYPGSIQMQSDAGAIRDALERNGPAVVPKGSFGIGKEQEPARPRGIGMER